jgi:HSP20 family protein
LPVSDEPQEQCEIAQNALQRPPAISLSSAKDIWHNLIGSQRASGHVIGKEYNMSEVNVEKHKPRAGKQPVPSSPWREFFGPVRPLRLFGLNPFAAMRDFSDELDRLFHTADSAEAWAPRSDVQFCNGNLVVTAELPGLTKEDVKVEITDGALVIEGERRREHREDHEGYHRCERSHGKFYRSIPLPEGAKLDQATAELSEGVLKITVPAAEVKKRRQIPVEDPAEKKLVAA